MRGLRKGMIRAALLVAALGWVTEAKAQYFEIANQLPNMISPALSGSFRYKGYVEVSGTAGFGDNRVNVLGVSTSQGFRYSSWFFMGAGLGVDVAMNNSRIPTPAPDRPDYWQHSSAKTKVMVPVFTDFRFNFGNMGGISMYADLKVGAMWLMGNSYLRLQNGCMTGDAQFYLKPSVGVRVPVGGNDSSHAVNIGLTYQLITSSNNYNYWRNETLTLNGLGVSIAYEW